MAYEEPGVKVIQQLTLEQANVASATQAAVIVGELYEVIADQVAGDYDPLVGAGDQSYQWPGKLSSSIVDLSGVRKATGETDSQLKLAAPFPLSFKLRDTSTGLTSNIDDLVDVYGVSQTGFSVEESSSAASLRVSGVTGTIASPGRLRLRTGGMINAGVVAGDRLRVSNIGGSPAFDVMATVLSFSDDEAVFEADGGSGVVSAATPPSSSSIVVDLDGVPSLPNGGNMALLVGSGSSSELLTFTSPPSLVGSQATFTLTTATRLVHDAGEPVKVLVVDQASTSVDNGAISTTSGQVQSSTAPFTSGDVGARIEIWAESAQDNSGSVAGAGFRIETGALSLTGNDVGKVVTIWSDDSAVSEVDGDLDTVSGQLSSALAVFQAADVGRVIAIDGQYRRITSVVAVSGPGVVTYSGSPLSGAAAEFTVFRSQQVRKITAVDATSGGTDFWVDAAVTATGGGLPVVVHRRELRDVTSLVSSMSVTYSGGNVTPEVGLGLYTPIRIFSERVLFQVAPLFQVLVSYRALNTSAVNETLVVRRQSQVSELGTVTKDNPLLWAARSALTAMGSSDVPLLLQSVKSFADGNETGFPEDKDETGGYLKALEQLSAVDSAYYLVPLTMNPTVRDAFASHVLAESQAEAKRERSAFLTYNLPLGAVESNTGIIAPGEGGGNKFIRDTGKGFSSVYGLIPGNRVVITSPAPVAGEYLVATGTNDDQLFLEGPNWLQDQSGQFLPGAVEFQVQDVSFGGQSGSTASFSAPVSDLVTVTGLSGMGAADVGRDLVVSAAVNGANIGSFAIVQFVSASSVVISHAAGVVEAGTIEWSVTADNTARSVTPAAFKDAEAGDYLFFGGQTRLVTDLVSGPGGAFTTIVYSGTSFSGNSGQTAGVVRTWPGVVFYAKPLNKDAQASALAGISQARGSRRVVHLWPDMAEQVTGTDQFGGEVREMLPSFFAAAAEAGAVSVLPPQRSSTGSSLPGFTGLKNSNKYFSRDQLNVIAGGGWTILEQGDIGAPVKVRHLLTTDMSSVKTQELSFTKNVDNMAKVKRASTEPLLNDENGRVNISTDLLAALAFPIQGIYETFVSRGQLVRTEGKPPYRILSIRQDPLAPDCILEDAELNVPLPANRVVVTFVI